MLRMPDGVPGVSDDDVAAKVRARLSERRMSQRALARRLSRGEVYVSRRLRGEVPFSAVELAHVAQILDVPVERLLVGAQ